MEKTHVVHLLDDTTPGGVMRMLDHLLTTQPLNTVISQSTCILKRGALSVDKLQADVLVSHLALSWRCLPALLSLRARHPNARIVHVEHSYTRAFTAHNVLRKARFMTMLRTSYALFDHIVAVSKEQADWLSSRALVKDENLSVINPQVDMSDLDEIARPDPEKRVVGAFGRLEPQKGFDILIEAFLQVTDPRARLKIFGDGSERDTLQAMAASDPRISFEGQTNSLKEAYEQVNLVAMPSRWEAYGLVAQEAKHAGRCVLVSQVDGLKDQMCAGITGVDDPSPTVWTEAITNALNDPPVCTATNKIDPVVRRKSYADKWFDALQPEVTLAPDTQTKRVLGRSAHAVF